MKSAGRTDIGLVRKVNEDNYICEMLELGFDTWVYIVADGMGGHNAGEVASTMAVQEILSYIKSNIKCLEKEEKRILDLIRKAILHANDKVYKKSILNSNCMGMGTTLSMVLVKGSELYVGHVGDSRIYLIRDGAISRLTEDHSLVAELVRTGTIQPEEAKHHPQKNVITRALGTEYTLEVDVSASALKDTDFILLCTDGLSNMVEDEEIKQIIISAENVESACEMLVDRAKDSGGYDNITAIVIQINEGGDCDDR